MKAVTVEGIAAGVCGSDGEIVHGIRNGAS